LNKRFLFSKFLAYERAATGGTGVHSVSENHCLREIVERRARAHRDVPEGKERRLR
jgi:hypothetical protein